MNKFRLSRLFIRLLSVLLLLILCTPAQSDDELNCVLCHKYRGLSRIDEDHQFRLYYINQELFDNGPHRHVACKDCHDDIDRIPHNPAKKVDCTQECHIIEPSGQANFSHKSVAKTLAKSAHGRLDANGNPKEYQEDYPDCKSCHDEPLYRPFSIYKGEKVPGMSKRAISRCESCHTSGTFAQDFYEHVTTRLPLETIQVCAKCHKDPGFRERHKLDDVITSYNDTFHAKLLRLGSERMPDCIDCHVVAGENAHLIEAKDNTTSAVNKNNVATTCRTSDCHASASPQLASFQTHVTYDRKKYPMQFYMLIFFKALMAFVLYFFLALIFLELLRRLFPNFAFFKEKHVANYDEIVSEIKDRSR